MVENLRILFSVANTYGSRLSHFLDKPSIVRALRCKKYVKIWVSKGQIKSYSRTIFNTLEINFRLLDILILLVAVDIHLNLWPSSFWIARHIDVILTSKKLIVMILFSDEPA